MGQLEQSLRLVASNARDCLGESVVFSLYKPGELSISLGFHSCFHATACHPYDACATEHCVTPQFSAVIARRC